MSRSQTLVRSAIVAAGSLALIVTAAGCSSVGPTGSSSSSSSSSSAAADAPSSSSTGSTSSGSGTAAGSQTKAQACTILSSSLQDLATKMSSSYSKYASDPKAAVADLQTLSSTFHANVAKVTEPGALAVGKKADADLTQFVADTQKAIADPQSVAAKIQKEAPVLQKDFAAVGTYCG